MYKVIVIANRLKQTIIYNILRGWKWVIVIMGNITMQLWGMI